MRRRAGLAPCLAKSLRRRSFRERKVALETQRAALSAHLHLFGEAAQRHPVYKHAEKLLNETFRKEKLAQRAAVLKSAAWLITLLEQLSGTGKDVRYWHKANDPTAPAFVR
jgi:hypothetical protein